MTQSTTNSRNDCVLSLNAGGSSSVVLVCEHASYHIPEQFDSLGLTQHDRKSHAAWDPGAMATAELLSARLDARLIAGAVSRLVYDCNRPPDAPDAMPARSEIIDIPGNADLSQSDRDARVARFYAPFQSALAAAIAQTNDPVIVTIHSFTPVYYGAQRTVEIGVLHDSDTRLADAMLSVVRSHTQADVQRNQPYGPENGVTHTLQEHGVKRGHPNVMLEIRNDLIATAEQQDAMANVLCGWIADAFAQLHRSGVVQCQA